jgi:hypothetical protein
MKQVIVLAAILPIVLVMIAQVTLEAGRSLRMSAAEDAVRAFCIEASYYHGGGAAEGEALRERLAQIFRANAGEVHVDLTQTDVSHIDWRVSFPIGDIMAGADMMGISAAENRGYAQMNGTIVIAPDPSPSPEDGEQDGDGNDDGKKEDHDTPGSGSSGGSGSSDESAGAT